MSAAEKLKALDGKLCVDEGYHEYVRFDALPQIVAVVEAADDFTGYDWHAVKHLTAPLEGMRALDAEDVEKLKESRRKTQAALAALDEALMKSALVE